MFAIRILWPGCEHDEFQVKVAFSTIRTKINLCWDKAFSFAQDGILDTGSELIVVPKHMACNLLNINEKVMDECFKISKRNLKYAIKGIKTPKSILRARAKIWKEHQIRCDKFKNANDQYTHTLEVDDGKTLIVVKGAAYEFSTPLSISEDVRRPILGMPFLRQIDMLSLGSKSLAYISNNINLAHLELFFCNLRTKCYSQKQLKIRSLNNPEYETDHNILRSRFVMNEDDIKGFKIRIRRTLPIGTFRLETKPMTSFAIPPKGP